MKFSMMERNRLDHLLPQGYLDGFTNPSVDGELWVLDVANTRWFRTGTAGVAAIKGFYDYSPGSNPTELSDDVFRNLENTFPGVRREFVTQGFSGWRKHLGFLLEFAQMLRTRSEFFRQENLANTRQSQILRVEKVVDEKTLRVRAYEPEGEEFAKLARNKSITDMHMEIEKGAAWLLEFDWCIRIAKEPAEPVITIDAPIVVQGKTPKLEEAVKDPDSLIFFPLCWKACLFGSRMKFDIETDFFEPRDSATLRRIYLQTAQRFVYSPLQFAPQQ